MSTQPAHKRKVTRGSGRNRNTRGTGGSIQNSQSHSNQVTVPGVYSNAHFVHAAAVLKGLKVQVVVLSNTKYEGIFNTISPSAEIVLELAHMVEGTNTVPSKERTIEKLVIKAKDVVSLTAKDVDLDYAVKSDIQSGFMTDTDISGKKSNGQAGERELEQWTPSNDTSADLSLDGDTNGWSAEDMFNANKKRFGYESSYDKSLQDYTTVLHKDDSEEFRIKQERANKLAREIEESAGYNQRAEIELDDGQTEEERFSAVQRPKPRMSPSQQTRSGSPKGNTQFDSSPKYIPPPLRSNPKPTQRNYNQPSHKPHPQAQANQRVHTQHMMRQPRVHMGTDDRLNMQDVRMDNRPSQDVRLSSQDARLSPQDARLSPQDARLSPQDARLAYEPRSQRSAAQVVAGTNPQHGMVPQQTNMIKPREVKPEPMGRIPSPGPPKQPTKDIARVPSPMAESNPHQPVTEDKKTQKSQKTQKIIELNEFSNNFRLQDNQSVATNNHATTQVIEPKPVKSLNPAAPTQVNQQPPSQSPQTRPVQPTTQPHPPAAVTQVIQPQPLQQVATPKLAQVPPTQVLILQQPQPTHPQPATQPTRPVEEKKSDFKLNPNAKEFSPSAKPFTPQLRKVSHSKTPTPPRPQSRQSQSPTLHQPIQVQHVIPGSGQPQFVISPSVQPLIYQIPVPKYKNPKSTATNLPPSQRPQQPGEMPSQQVISVSNATGPPLVATPHFQHLPTYPQHPVTHPGQILPGQTILQPHPMHPMMHMQQQKLPYRSGHPNPLSNVPQSQTQLHSLPPDVSGNPPVFVTPQGPNQVYPGQQQQSLYGQQGGQQHPPGTHHQMVPSSHPHPHGGPQPVQPVQNQGLGQPHQGQQGHRPTPSPVQHPIQSPSQPTQPNVIVYNVPQHSQPIQGHTPQSQQTFTTVLMHQQQQQPQPQPYSATSHSITNMTTVHTSPHPHPHVQPNMMYVGQTGPPHSHTVMLPSGIPSGNIQYLPQQQGQGQHPPIQAYQQGN